MTFRTRAFATALLTAAVTLGVAMALLSYDIRRQVTERIERSLVAEAQLAAETLSQRRPATSAELDAEADALGRLISARVTFIAPDGAVVGDSDLPAEALHTLENHATRPEVLQAQRDGLGSPGGTARPSAPTCCTWPCPERTPRPQLARYGWPAVT